MPSGAIGDNGVVYGSAEPARIAYAYERERGNNTANPLRPTSRIRRVHSYPFALVNPAALGPVRVVPRSVVDIAVHITRWLSPSVIAIIAIYSRRVTSGVQRFADRISTRGSVPLSVRVRRISR